MATVIPLFFPPSPERQAEIARIADRIWAQREAEREAEERETAGLSTSTGRHLRVVK